MKNVISSAGAKKGGLLAETVFLDDIERAPLHFFRQLLFDHTGPVWREECSVDPMPNNDAITLEAQLKCVSPSHALTFALNSNWPNIGSASP